MSNDFKHLDVPSSGGPLIKGTKVRVSKVIEALANGDSLEQIAEHHKIDTLQVKNALYEVSKYFSQGSRFRLYTLQELK